MTRALDRQEREHSRSEARRGADRPDTTFGYRVGPRSGWASLDLSELWRYRDLFLILARREVQLRYRQTWLGIAWVVLQPLLPAVLFAAIFGTLARLPSDGAPYLLFAFVGLLAWNLVASSVQRAGTSLVGDAQLVSKVYFPRALVPLASTAGALVDLAVGLVFALVLVVALGVPLGPPLLALPAMIALATALGAGVGLLVSALNVHYRDFGYALGFVIQLWLFASPVVYPSTLVPESWRGIYALNPMVGIIDGFRWSLLDGTTFPATSVFSAAVVTVAVLLAASLVFARTERTFADVI